MKDYKIYTERLEKSLDEKLFFLKELKNVDFNNCTFIDFGCANGLILKYLDEHYPNCNLIGVEKDINFRRELEDYFYDKHTGYTRIVSDIDEALGNIDEEYPIILILSSVLHEMTFHEQVYIFNFARTYCDYVVIRDMHFVSKNNYFTNRNKDYYEYEEYIIDKIENHKDFEKLYKDKYYYTLKKNNIYCTRLNRLAEFLLKYEYDENWETEKEENYFNASWYIFEKNFSLIYRRDYTLQYKKDKIKEDFDIDVTFFTHRQAIYSVENKEHKEIVLRMEE